MNYAIQNTQHEFFSQFYKGVGTNHKGASLTLIMLKKTVWASQYTFGPR